MVLHGDRFPSDTEEGLEQLVEGPLTVVRVSSTATLGDALNAGTDAASGELITKMDDDDWYGPEHLWDLVSAAEYSGAELVARGGVRLPRAARPHDSALRGQGRELEPYRRGGTLTISRRNLEALGGWRPLAHGVDTALVADVERAGGRVFRTHGFGYIYRRHGARRGSRAWTTSSGNRRGSGADWTSMSPRLGGGRDRVASGRARGMRLSPGTGIATRAPSSGRDCSELSSRPSACASPDSRRLAHGSSGRAGPHLACSHRSATLLTRASVAGARPSSQLRRTWR